MNRKELEEKIAEILEPYSRPELPLTQLALKSLSMEELIKTYQYSSRASKPKKVKRPRCPPVTSEKPSIGNKSLYTYKCRMCSYIAEATGGRIRFEQPTLITTGLLECTANYIERKKH
jgi:hypothetical protein